MDQQRNEFNKRIKEEREGSFVVEEARIDTQPNMMRETIHFFHMAVRQTFDIKSYRYINYAIFFYTIPRASKKHFSITGYRYTFFPFGNTVGLRESGVNIQLLHSRPCARPPASCPGRWLSARGRAGWSTLGTPP